MVGQVSESYPFSLICCNGYFSYHIGSYEWWKQNTFHQNHVIFRLVHSSVFPFLLPSSSEIKVLEADMLDLPFSNESFDVVIEKGTMVN